MRTYGMTDIGLHRQENQDAFDIGRWRAEAQVFAVVCDGMGGERGGQIASAVAVETYMEQLRALLREDMTPEQLREVSQFCVSRANSAVYQRASDDPACRGMGTTLVSAVTYENGAIICNIGDSRAYLLRGHAISRVTHDHSVVENLVQHGEITLEQARTHPNRNLITRALGPESSIPCDTYELTFERGDILLLCTDGLIVAATDEEILDAVCAHEDLQDSLNALIDLARQHGAPDNVTAVLLQNL